MRNLDNGLKNIRVTQAEIMKAINMKIKDIDMFPV